MVQELVILEWGLTVLLSMSVWPDILPLGLNTALHQSMGAIVRQWD